MTLQADEFLRRFFLHVLPKGFVRIRSFGFLANRFRRQKLALCRGLLPAPAAAEQTHEATGTENKAEPHSWSCPHCGTPMVIIQRFTFWRWPSRGSFVEAQ